MKLYKKIILFSTILLIILFIMFFIILRQWFYSYQPLPGIWQYIDDDLEIVVYIPSDGGISTPSGYAKCKTELLYKGDKQKAILSYHTKLYQFNIVIVDDYSDIMIPNIEFGSGSIFSSTYHTPIKNGVWELKDISVSDSYKELFKDYEGANLIFQRIGDYKDPE